ncbi:hypothetical protein BU15DRAFT_53302, partial [Melanogaster broomeanus]
VINTSDMMDFLTSGFYKPTIYRAVQPPEDQSAYYDRLESFYFRMPDDDVRLLPLMQRIGIESRCQCPDDEAPLPEVWRKGITATCGCSELKKGSEKDVEEEVIEAIVVKHYN